MLYAGKELYSLYQKSIHISAELPPPLNSFFAAEVLLHRRSKESAGLPEQPRLGFMGLWVYEILGFGIPVWRQGMARYRKVTIWPLVQVSSGRNSVSVMPLAMFFSAPQAIASA